MSLIRVIERDGKTSNVKIDEPGKEIEATIKMNAQKFQIPCRVYQHSDFNKYVKPFFIIDNDELCFCCGQDTDLEKLKDPSFWDIKNKNYDPSFLYFLIKHMDREKFSLGLDTLKYGNNKYNVNFIDSKDEKMHLYAYENKSFKSKHSSLVSTQKSASNKSKDINQINLDIAKPKNWSRWQTMVKIEKDINKENIKQMIESISKEMGIYARLADIEIRSPYDFDFYSKGKVSEAALYPTTLAQTYKTNVPSRLEEPYSDSNCKCDIYFSPWIYFMPPEDQKTLIVHELAHIKAGVNHGHDSVFWDIFEKYSGKSRKDDWAWSNDIEKNDNEKFLEQSKQNHPMTAKEYKQR